MTNSVTLDVEIHRPTRQSRRRHPCIGSRDPAHVLRWTSAMTTARTSRPDLRCTSISKTTRLPCTQPRMIGSDRCRHHLLGAARDAVDTRREARVRRAEHHGHHRLKPHVVENALNAIARRRLRRAWVLDPNLPGSTLELTDHDERTVRAWLLLQRIDLDDPHWTNQAIDKLRWSAALRLANRIDQPTVERRFAAITREVLRWRSRQPSSDAS